MSKKADFYKYRGEQMRAARTHQRIKEAKEGKVIRRIMPLNSVKKGDSHVKQCKA